VIVANFTGIYLPTLSTVGTLLALGTVYFARHDRRNEVADRWLDGFEQALRRVADGVVQVADAAEQERRRAHGGDEMIGGVKVPSGVRPATSVRVARMNLRAAIFALPTGGLSLPQCRVLIDQASWAVDPRIFEKALDEVGEAMNRIAQRRATDRSRRSSGLLRKLRVKRAFRRAKLGEPYK
jgi:hypothetical protein